MSTLCKHTVHFPVAVSTCNSSIADCIYKTAIFFIFFCTVGIVERVSPQAQQSWDMCEGNRNEPCTLPLLVELVAGCMQRPARQVIEETTRNAVCFFSLHKYANLNLDIK